MDIKFKNTLLFFLFFILALLYPKSIRAVSMYEITPGFPPLLATEGEVVHSASFSINYKGEEVILSGSTDGLQNITLDDTLEVIVTNYDGVKTRLTDVFGGCSGHIDRKPINITSMFTTTGITLVEVNLVNCGPSASSGAIYMLLNEKNDQLLDTGFVSSSEYQIVRGNWVNPENAFDDDLDYASIGTATSGSRAIRYSGFNFNIPAEAEIKGIAVRIDASGNRWGGINNIYQGTAKSDHGVSLGDDHLRMGSTKFAYIVGGPDELWGLNWTNENVNQLKVEYGAAAITTHRIYWIAAKVYYTLPEPANVVLDVPSFKQGLPPYDGESPNWETHIYDHGNELDLWCDTNRDYASMAECGCALSSASMVTNYHGVKSASGGFLIVDPFSLNLYAKEFFTIEGNGIKGFFGGNFNWHFIDNFSASIADENNNQKVEFASRENFSVERIKQLIDEDKPVIVNVIGKWGEHWVVVKGYDPETNRLIINDPAMADPIVGKYSYLDDLYTPKLNKSMIVYQKTNSDFRRIQFVTTSKNKILVTDSLGNKTGYDPTTNSTVESIPSSSYDLDNFYGDPTNPDPEEPSSDGVYFLTVKLPEDSEYKLQIISQDGEPHPVQVYTSDTEGGLAGKIITPDEPVENHTFIYNEEIAGEEVIGQEDIKTIEASIEVEPLIKSNIIIPHKLFTVPVAVLASGTFDVAKVDRGSVTFGKTGDEKSLIGCAKILIDVNRDKRRDLICYFYGDKLGLDTSDKKVFLKGKYEDKIFVGEDNVNVWKPWFLF